MAAGSAARGFSRADLAALGLIAAVWIGLLLGSKGPLSLSIVDDAYIYLRVVENLAAGAGWTFNPGDAVNPLTSPLYALCLLAVARATPPGPAPLFAVYALGLLAIAGLQYAALRDRGRLFAAVVATISSTGYVVLHAVGMETSLYLALVLATALAYQRGRFLATGLLAGLVALARPEGIALAGVIGLLHLLTRRRFLWPLLLGFALPVLPWLGFAWFAFGEILPHTVGVKAAQSHIGWWGLQDPWLLAFLRQPALPILTAAIAALGAWWAIQECRRGRPYLIVILGFAAVQVAGYSLLQAPVGYFWYFAPGNLGLDTALTAGLFASARHLQGWWGDRPGRALWRSGAGAARPAAMLRLAGATALALLAVNQIGARPWGKIKPYRLADAYLDAGRWIAQNTPAQARVACTEIGYLGYYSGRPIRDIHGLIHPEAIAQIKREQMDWWFAADPPELIVVHVPPWRGEPAPEWWPPASLETFAARYRELYALPTLKVYGREGPAAPGDAGTPDRRSRPALPGAGG